MKRLAEISSRAMFALVVTMFFAPDALAQRWERVEASGARPIEHEAIAFLDSYFATQPRVLTTCSGALFTSESPVTEYDISSVRVRVSICRGTQVFELPFADYPMVGRLGQRRGQVCVSGHSGPDFRCSIMLFDAADAQAFANAWLALAHPLPRDPATDAAFQAALQTARASGVDRTEENRRVQVQVEALLSANRAEEAATRYREALAASPDWADGHYNLALVAGELGEHTEAINAMRRYLYLNPNAADARAAQDQIYRWEALMSEGTP
jgi:tetratricopeptide (TPR) repeat protein